MKISKITLGTVNFGQNYGLRKKEKNKISKKNAIKIIRKAFKNGINSFDTSPNYGNAEKILGEALKNKKCLIATKVYINYKKNILNLDNILKSINKSRKNLNKKRLDYIQIHNANENIFKNSKFKEFFLNLKKKKIVKRVGTTVYTQREALASIESGWIESIQVPYNLINQDMNKKVFNFAKKNNIKIFTRSTFLKGLLTDKINFLPQKMKILEKEIKKKLTLLNLEINDLKELALKFVTSNKKINSVVVGVENFEQLNEIINLKKKGFSNSYLNKLSYFNSKLKLRDPRLWPFI